MPQEDSDKKEICYKCKIELTNENKVKNKRICRICSNIDSKEYKKRNKQAISEYNKKYKLENKEKISIYNRTYNVENRKTIQKRHTAYLREKRKTDINYKIGVNCRNRIKKLIKSEINTCTLLNCSKKFLIDWLSSNFTDDMTLENYGSYWHIDHVIPCKHFNLSNKDELLKCFNWLNLQPLKAQDNLSKGDKIDIESINNHWEKINTYIKNKKIKALYTFKDYESYITTSSVQIDEGTRLIAVPKGKKI